MGLRSPSAWDGMWLTKRGGVTIYVNGDTATVEPNPGDLIARYGGSFDVISVDDQRMIGEWRMPRAGMEGTFQWTLDENGRAFSGQFSEAIGAEEDSSWWGARQ